MKHIGIIIIVALLAGCQHEKNTRPQEQSTAKFPSEWKQGDVVELTGSIHPARTDAKYFIETADGRGVSIRSDAIDKLGAGTTLWVKGKIEYVHYPKPKDYDNDRGGVNYGVRFPQSICYLRVSEYKELNPQPTSSGDGKPAPEK